MNLNTILDYINSHFNQEHRPKYNTPYKIEDIVIFFWEVGAIVLSGSLIRTISEDDGNWFESGNSGIYMSSSWIPKFVECLNTAYRYLEENGEPYYYTGTNNLCGYRL